jgi:hypothetical protein
MSDEAFYGQNGQPFYSNDRATRLLCPCDHDKRQDHAAAARGHAERDSWLSANPSDSDDFASC